MGGLIHEECLCVAHVSINRLAAVEDKSSDDFKRDTNPNPDPEIDFTECISLINR